MNILLRLLFRALLMLFYSLYKDNRLVTYCTVYVHENRLIRSLGKLIVNVLTGFDLSVSFSLDGQDENPAVDSVLGRESHVGLELQLKRFFVFPEVQSKKKNLFQLHYYKKFVTTYLSPRFFHLTSSKRRSFLLEICVQKRFSKVFRIGT